MSIPDAPAFCNRLTKEEYELQSKKATSEAMKKLAELLNQNEVEKHALSISSDSDSESVSDTEDYKIRELENRIHYLTLDMANANAEIENLRTENESLNDEHLSHLQYSNAINRANREFNALKFEKEEYLVRDLEKILRTLEEDINRVLPKVIDPISNKAYQLYYKKTNDELEEVLQTAKQKILVDKIIDTAIIILITITFYVLLTKLL